MTLPATLDERRALRGLVRHARRTQARYPGSSQEARNDFAERVNVWRGRRGRRAQGQRNTQLGAAARAAGQAVGHPCRTDRGSPLRGRVRVQPG